MMGMNRQAQAEWQGNIRSGRGRITTESLVLKNTPYDYESRFGQKHGTNPEELIAAALSGCYSMAFTALLQRDHYNPARVTTDVEVEMSQNGEGWGVHAIHLTTSVELEEEVSDSRLQSLAEETKRNCPIAKLLNAPITVTAKLVQKRGELHAAH
jgi:osmotically inducible protein OsmC